MIWGPFRASFRPVPKSTGSSDHEERRAREADDGPLERAADRALAAVRRAPPLALMAVVAGLFELALARVGWHGLTDTVPAADLLEARRVARFPRNLAAVSGIVTLTFALLAFLRLPGYAPVGRRLAVAAFSGIFVPSVVVATFLPQATVRPRLVIFGLAAANVLVCLLGMTAVRYRPGRALRTAIAGATLSCFLTLLFVGLGQLAQASPEGFWGAVAGALVDHSSATQDVRLTLRHLGELCWLAPSLAGAWAVVVADRGPGTQRRIGVALGLAVTLAVALLLARETVGRHYELALFGAFRLGLLLDVAPEVYALPLAAGLAGGLVGLGRPDPRYRQLGAGMLAWIAAGFAPHTPIQLLYLVLGTTLLTRSAQALDPEGTWRTRHPWARLAGTSTPRRAPPPRPELDPAIERDTFDDVGEPERSRAGSADRVRRGGDGHGDRHEDVPPAHESRED